MIYKAHESISGDTAQAGWGPGSVTFPLPAGKRLAARERERLWTGLERFVKCGDSLEDYAELEHNFPSFWPATLTYEKAHREGARISTEALALNWNPACHKLFLVYRDTLRRLWLKEKNLPIEMTFAPEFLLGVENDWHRPARESAEAAIKGYKKQLAPPPPPSLVDAWRVILEQFPSARFLSPARVWIAWPSTEIRVSATNDFQLAFYVLFRENWRARVCRRCEQFFVARKPKQMFCGTGCSARSRLASSLKWWHAVGAKRRASQRQKAKRSRTERNHQ